MLNIVTTNSEELESSLYNLQLIFLIDVSGSMQTVDVDPEGKGVNGMLGPCWTRYDNMVKLLKNMVNDMFMYDKDKNIPCFFFNHQVHEESFTDPNMLLATVRMHKPTGTTALAEAFQASLKCLNDLDNFLYIVFTDGAPDNTQNVEEFIYKNIYTKDPSGNRINILFVRFGDDRGAIQFLQYLDDHPTFGNNVDAKSDNAAYLLGPKLLILNGLYEHVEKLPEWQKKLAQVP